MATLVAALLGLLLLYFAHCEKLAALKLWGWAYLLAAMAVGSWTQLGTAPGHLISGAVGASGIVASGLFWNAARVFHGRPQTWSAILAGVAGWIAVSALPFEAMGLRLVVGASLIALFAGLASHELWSERRRSMLRKWPALVLPILHGSVLVLPVLLGDLLTHDTFLGSTLWPSIFAIELVLYAIASVFVVVLLVAERHVRAHKTAALTDPLTGMLNRRGFGEAAMAMIEQQTRASRAVSLLVFDIDRFKKINDSYGHASGDEILRLFAATVTGTLRATDVSARLGGEEFVALLPCTTAEAAIAAERVRAAFADSDVAIDDVPIDTTVSVGVASAPACDADWKTLLVAADAALYRAKESGRNRVELAQSHESPSPNVETGQRHRIVVGRAPMTTEFAA
jgi:diguanylate cyclase (GGDEF)-like protein